MDIAYRKLNAQITPEALAQLKHQKLSSRVRTKIN